MRPATASSAMKAMIWSLPPQGTRHVRAGRVDVRERGPRKGLAPEPDGSGACGVAGCTGLEPVASGVTGRRYNQLN